MSMFDVFKLIVGMIAIALACKAIISFDGLSTRGVFLTLITGLTGPYMVLWSVMVWYHAALIYAVISALILVVTARAIQDSAEPDTPRHTGGWGG